MNYAQVFILDLFAEYPPHLYNSVNINLMEIHKYEVVNKSEQIVTTIVRRCGGAIVIMSCGVVA